MAGCRRAGTGAWGDRVAAAEAVLVGAEEPQRLNQMEMLLGTGHGDIKQTALFLGLRRIAGGHVRGDAAVDRVQDEHDAPLLSLRGMDGRQDQIVFIEQRNASLIAGRVGRIERKFGEETLAGGIAACDLFELVEVSAA